MNRIILPLDNTPWEHAQKIMKRTTGLVWGYKIRRSILEKGIEVIREVKRYGNVMVDFKLYDIPSAMTESIRAHIDHGANITTVHCTASYSPAMEGMRGDSIAGVTILTSMGQDVFDQHYKGGSISDMVEYMAEEAYVRYGYLVCSPQELQQISHVNIKKICPGIRPLWYQKQDDQVRMATPSMAIMNKADFLVIGRPLLNAPDIVTAIKRTNKEISEAGRS